jgi:hypothetical protein
VFAGGREAVGPELTRLKDAAIAAFGIDEARALIGTLGPSETSASVAQRDCDCSNADSFCHFLPNCTNWPIGCNYDDSGCGTFWVWPCDGICQFPPS